jgi:tetratricopeptide (TPR) repeat protein
MAGFGKADDLNPNERVSISPSVDLGAVQVTVEEGFVLSRVDGSSSIKTICLISGMGEETTLGILRRLHDNGIILLGDEKPRPLKTPRITRAPRPTPGTNDMLRQYLVDSEEAERTSSARRRRTPGGPPPPGAEIREVLAHVRKFHSRLGEMDYFELLGIPATDDFSEIRRGYFRQAKRYHPDRFFSKDIGEHKEMLQDIFKHLRTVYSYLQDEDQLATYLEHVGFRSTHPTRARRTTGQRPQPERGRRAGTGRLRPRFGRPPPQAPARRKRRTTSEVVNERLRQAHKCYERGVAHLERGDFNAAVSALRMAMSYSPDNAEFQLRYQEAINRARAVTADSYYNRGLREERAGRREQAASLYVKAADLADNATYLTKAAVAMMWAEDLLRAQDYVRKAVKKAPDSAEAHMVLGRVLHAQGSSSDACRELERALKIDPDLADAKRLLEKIR